MMGNIKVCKKCKGSGVIQYLVSMHDDVTDYCKCPVCHGRGKRNYMTKEEENDYRRNNGKYE